MTPKSAPSTLALVVTFLAAAALGAVVVALTTPRTGRHLRHRLRGLVWRGRDRLRRAAAGLRGRDGRSRRTYAWKTSRPDGAIHLPLAGSPDRAG